ncbi:hypothetical protein PENTCL1PPCAC_29486, partial [Pristionchus entomophagus]
SKCFPRTIPMWSENKKFPASLDDTQPHDPPEEQSPPVTPAPPLPDLSSLPLHPLTPVLAPRRCLSIVPEANEEKEDAEARKSSPFPTPTIARNGHCSSPSSVSVHDEITALPSTEDDVTRVTPDRPRGLVRRFTTWVRRRLSRREADLVNIVEEQN